MTKDSEKRAAVDALHTRISAECAEYETHLQESELLLASLAIEEAEQNAAHKLAKKKFEDQRDYVTGLRARGNLDNELNLFHQEETEEWEPGEGD